MIPTDSQTKLLTGVADFTFDPPEGDRCQPERVTNQFWQGARVEPVVSLRWLTGPHAGRRFNETLSHVNTARRNAGLPELPAGEYDLLPTEPLSAERCWRIQFFRPGQAEPYRTYYRWAHLPQQAAGRVLETSANIAIGSYRPVVHFADGVRMGDGAEGPHLEVTVYPFARNIIVTEEDWDAASLEKGEALRLGLGGPKFGAAGEGWDCDRPQPQGELDKDAGETPVSCAARLLRAHKANPVAEEDLDGHPSTYGYSEIGGIDTLSVPPGVTRYYTFHLRGFTRKEREELFERVTR